jgi:hypothetical protein
MNRRIKKKYDKRGLLIEVLQTSVFGLVFDSKTTFEYDEGGYLTLEADWYDMKTIKATRRYESVSGKKKLIEEATYSREGNRMALQRYPSDGELARI